MLFRNIVLALGALLVFAGIALALFWLSQMGGPPPEVKQEPQRPVEVRRDAVLEAVRPLPAGTLLRPGDFRWREIGPGEMRPGAILRKDTSENEYLGAIVTKDFAAGEALTTGDLVKTTDRRFLSAVLKPGMRAVTIAVDAPQSSAGMALPGDHVDVLLTQNLSGVAGLANDPSRKTVGETVLRDVRVIAVDQRLQTFPHTKPNTPEAAPAKDTAPKEARMPRTATLELTETQAEKLFVAAQLGGLQLPVRALEDKEEASPAQEAVPPTKASKPAEDVTKPTWAADVSPALKQISEQQAQAEAQQKAQTELLKSQAEQTKAQADERKAQAALNKAQADERKAQAELTKYRAMLLRQRVTGSTIEAHVRRPRWKSKGTRCW